MTAVPFILKIHWRVKLHFIFWQADKCTLSTNILEPVNEPNMSECELVNRPLFQSSDISVQCISPSDCQRPACLQLCRCFNITHACLKMWLHAGNPPCSQQVSDSTGLKRAPAFFKVWLDSPHQLCIVLHALTPRWKTRTSLVMWRPIKTSKRSKWEENTTHLFHCSKCGSAVRTQHALAVRQTGSPGKWSGSESWTVQRYPLSCSGGDGV